MSAANENEQADKTTAKPMRMNTPEILYMVSIK
jgi:hypothetical protein